MWVVQESWGQFEKPGSKNATGWENLEEGTMTAEGGAVLVGLPIS